MIKFNINKNVGTKFRVSGTPRELTNETLLFIWLMHKEMKRKDEGIADEFKRTIIGCLLDPNSPVWKLEE